MHLLAGITMAAEMASHTTHALAAGEGVYAILIFAGFAALIVFGVIASIKAAQKRRDAMRQLALDLRMDYDPAEHAGGPPGSEAFHVFHQGDARRHFNTLTGTRPLGNGRPLGVRMGDYRYTTESGSGKDRRRTTHRISYLLIRLPFPVAEQLGIRREGFFDKIAGAIGFEDIDFESLEFSKTYHVSSSDRKVAYDLLDPRMIEWCLANPIPRLEIRGPWMLVCEQRTWEPAQFRERLEWSSAFVERWPTHLVQRLEQAAGT